MIYTSGAESVTRDDTFEVVDLSRRDKGGGYDNVAEGKQYPFGPTTNWVLYVGIQIDASRILLGRNLCFLTLELSI